MSQPPFASWFAELDRLLASAAALWQVQTFASRDYPWGDSHPELVEGLQGLTTPQLELLEQQPAQLARWLGPRLVAVSPVTIGVADIGRLLDLALLPPLAKRELQLPPRFEVGIAGGKWQQICQFVARLPAESQSTLEWCAGKGHLGRLLAALTSSEVTSLEWQPALCAKGTELASRCGVQQVFSHADALAAGSACTLDRHQRAIALHACGDLHTTLMNHWLASASRSLAISPCCYHLVRGDYQPLSAAGQSAQVRLTRADLGLPQQEVVTGGAGVRRQRQRQLLWRLAFDEWQRDLRGVDDYLPLPAIRQSLLSGSFSDFLGWAARRKGLPIPAPGAAEQCLAQGAERTARVRRVELVTQLFRRPLETWLLLDRVLYLQEHGAEVTLGEFCERQVTPRNAMILATKPG